MSGTDIGVAPQEPQGQPQEPIGSAYPTVPQPETRKERLMKLLKLHSDARAQPIVNDEGAVLLPAIEHPVARTIDAMDALNGYINQSEKNRDAFFAYYDGTTRQIPPGWEVDESVRPSPRTMQAQAEYEGWRKQNPGAATVQDVLSTVGAFAPAAAQVTVNQLAGIGNLLGGHFTPWDVKSKMQAAAMAVAHPDSRTFAQRETEARALEQERSKASGPVGRAATAVSEAAGTFAGFGVGTAGKAMGSTPSLLGKVGTLPQTLVMGAGGKIGQGVGYLTGKVLGKALTGEKGLQEAMTAYGEAAGGFGAYEYTTATDKEGKPISGKPLDPERLKALGMGALAGAVLKKTTDWAKSAFEGILNSGAKSLGVTEREAVDAMMTWIKKNEPPPVGEEAAAKWLLRGKDAWIDNGMQGLPKMQARRLLAFTTRGLIEGSGFTTLDHQFQEALFDKVLQGDMSGFQTMLERYLVNAGSAGFMAAMHHPLSMLPTLDRAKTGPEIIKERLPQFGPASPTPAQRLDLSHQRTQQRLRTDIEKRAAEGQMGGTLQAGVTNELPGVYQNRNAPEAFDPLESLFRMNWQTVPPPEQKPQEPEPGVHYNKDDTRREFMAQQADKFPEGEATVQVGANVANLALRFFPQNSRAYADLRAAAEANGGAVRFTADEARKFIDYHARSAPRRRTAKTGNLEVEQSNIQALDSLGESLVSAFGLGKEPPRGEQRQGPPPGPGMPAGELYRGEVTRAPQRWEGDTPGAYEIQLPGTGHTIMVDRDGETAKADPALEDLLGLDGPIPLKEMVDMIGRIGRIDAMHGGWRLPGTKVSGYNAFAEPGKGGKAPLVRAIFMGELYEGELGPNMKWRKATDAVDNGGSDIIDPPQQAVVDALREILNQRTDVSPGARAELSEAITLLSNRAARNDEAIAMSMEVMPDLLAGLSGGSPQHADRLIRTLGEILTTKIPDIAIDDMFDEQAAKQRMQAEGGSQPQGQGPPEPKAEPTPKSTETPARLRDRISQLDKIIQGLDDQHETSRVQKASGAELLDIKRSRNQAAELRDRLREELKGLEPPQPKPPEGMPIAPPGWEWEKTGEKAYALRRIQPEAAPQPDEGLAVGREAMFASGIRAKVIDFRDGGREVMVQPMEAPGRPQLNASPIWVERTSLRPAPEMRRDPYTGEMVPVRRDPEQAGSVPYLNIWDWAQAAARVIGPVFDNPITRAATQQLQDRVRDLVRRHYKEGDPRREFAERMFNVEANTRRLEGAWNPILQEMVKLASTRLPALEQLTNVEPNAEGNVAGYEAGHIAMEDALTERLGPVGKSFSDKVQAVIDAWHRAHYATREKAAEAGMHTRNQAGDWVPISRTARRDVMTRQPTAEAADAIMVGRGKLYEAIVSVLMSENGMTQEEVKARFAHDFHDAQGLHRLDPLEIARSFRYFPDHVTTADGETTRLLETHPLSHVKSLFGIASKRIGMHQEFGEDKGGVLKEGALEGVRELSLALPYRDVVSTFDPGDRNVIAMAFRAMAGMTVSRPPDWYEHLAPGGSGMDKALRVFGALNDLAAGSKMTKGSWVQNIIEPFATGAATLGQRRMGQAWNEGVKALFDGNIKQWIQDRVDAGGFAVHAPEWLAGGEKNPWDQLISYMRTGKNAFLVPFELTQMFADAVLHRATHMAIDEWKQGGSDALDVAGLRNLWQMEQGHAEQIVNGDAPPEAYEKLLLTALPRLSRRGDLPQNKSSFSLMPGAHFVKFVGYFQRNFNTYRQALVNLKEAKTDAEKKQATLSFLALNGRNLAAQFAAQSAVAALGGLQELYRFWRESWEDVQTLGGASKLGLTAFMGSFLGATGSFLTGSLRALFTGRSADKASAYDTAMSMVPGARAIADGAEFTAAMTNHALGEPPAAGSDYSGKSALQGLGHFISKQVPGLNWETSGPLGLGFNYAGTDPDLENDIKAAYRWDHKNAGIIPERADTGDAAFLDVMRKAASDLRAEHPDMVQVAQDIRDHLLAQPQDPDKKQQTPLERRASVADSLRNRQVLGGQSWHQLSKEQQQRKLGALGEDSVARLRAYDAILERTAKFFQPQR